MTVRLEGRLFSGMEVAKEYLSMEEYQERIRDKTGFRPFPGTLNLNVDDKKTQKLAETTEKARIPGFRKNNTGYSGLDLYPVKIEGFNAYYIDIDVTDYEDNVVEIIAPIKLREKLGLEDGDKVEVTTL